MWGKIKNSIFKSDKIDYLVVGLGNPGEKYKKTAHNVGFRVVNNLQERGSFSSLEKEKYLNALIAKGSVEEKKIVLLLPQTFMNLSGVSVKKALIRFKINTQNLIIIHDDTDLPLGMIRFSFSRGSAGHKGVESIIKSIKSKNFIRVRVGVRKEGKEARYVVLESTPSFMHQIEEKVTEEVIKSLSNNIFSKTVVIKTTK